jgi:hypothetical protein
VTSGGWNHGLQVPVSTFSRHFTGHLVLIPVHQSFPPHLLSPITCALHLGLALISGSKYFLNTLTKPSPRHSFMILKPKFFLLV